MKVLLLAALLLPYMAFSQKLVKDEQDKFNKWRVKETSSIIVSSKWGKKDLACYGRKVDNSVMLHFKVGLNHAFYISERSEISILIKNGEVVKLKCINGEVSNHLAAWYANGIYAVTEDDLNKLLNNKVSSIRVEIKGNSFVDFDLKDNHSDDIINLLSLLN